MLEEHKKRQEELGEEKLNELRKRVRNLPEVVTSEEDKATVFEAVYYGLMESWC